MHGNVIGFLCDSIAHCPPGPSGAIWDFPPGYPDDECRSQCSNTNNFECTAPAFRMVGIPVFTLLCNSTVWLKTFCADRSLYNE